MTFKEIQTLCLSYPGTSERISHGAPSFFIQEKMCFVQYRDNHHNDGKIALWCAAPKGAQAVLVEANPDIYFIPAYVEHLGWIGLRLDREATPMEVTGVIEDAYLVRAPKKLIQSMYPLN